MPFHQGYNCFHKHLCFINAQCEAGPPSHSLFC
jgi:hypothetical protein